MTQELKFDILFKKATKEWKKNKIFQKVIDCRDKNIKSKLCVILEKNIRSWFSHPLEIVMRDLHDEIYLGICDVLKEHLKFDFAKLDIQSIKNEFEVRLKNHTLFVDNTKVSETISHEYLWTLEDRKIIEQYFIVNKN